MSIISNYLFHGNLDVFEIFQIWFEAYVTIFKYMDGLDS